MKKMKKFSALLLTAAMTLSMAACGNSSAGTSTTEAASESTAETQTDLLLDEPFSALDALTRISMQEWLLKQWQHFHKTIMFITHDVEEAIFMSSKIYLVKQTPIHELEVLKVPMDYPRNRNDMGRPEIVELKEYLIDQLRKQVII